MKFKKSNIIEVIIVFIFAFTILLGAGLIQNISSVDDMWTYNFALKIYNGYVPYKDFNMVMTPLYAQLTAGIFNIFSPSMFTFKMIGIIECSLIIVMQFLIAKNMKIGNKLFLLSTFFTFAIMQFLVSNTYNLLAMLGIFLLIYIIIKRERYERFVEYKKEEKRIKIFKNINLSYENIFSIIEGLILGLIFISKQNIGVYAILGIIIYDFLRWKVLHQLTFKQAFKRLVINAIFCLAPITIEFIYLLSNNALYNFIDYTVFSVSHFGTKNYSSLVHYLLTLNILNFSTHVLVLFGMMNLFIIAIIKSINKFQIRNNIRTNIVMLFAILSVIAILFAYPLANKYHVDLSRYIIIFLVLMTAFSMKDIKRYLINNISKLSIIFIILTIYIFSLTNIYTYSAKLNRVTKIDQYNGMVMFLNDEYNILNVLDFKKSYEKIFNQKLYILSSDNNQYYIPLNENNNEFDLPLHGNLGKQDYNKIINKLESMNNFSVMITTKDENVFWQEPKEIHNYIKENYVYIMDYDKYSIYMCNNLQ